MVPFVIIGLVTAGILATIYGGTWAVMRWLDRCEAREKEE